MGPLLGRVELRESVSFATNKSDLCQGADELACVVSTWQKPDQDDEFSGEYMHLSDVTDQLLETSNADPLYRLFNANCRWFARRTILSVAQRLSILGAGCLIQWKGRVIDNH